jgi:hypothetical protein
MSSMPGVLSSIGAAWSWWYSKTQAAMFPPLTRVIKAHHRARGFDQAREVGRACHSKLMATSFSPT